MKLVLGHELKFIKIPFENSKNALFWCDFKKFLKPELNILRGMTKNTMVLEVFENVFNNFLRK